MKTLLLLLTLTLPSLCFANQAVIPGRVFEFPADHNLHPNFQSEWWYVTANLKGENGKDYGAQFTLFSNTVDVAGQPQRIFFAHAALSSQTAFYHGERYARADMNHAGVTAQPWQAYIDHWSFDGSGTAPLPGQLTVVEPQFGYQLNLSQSPYFLLGEQGFSAKNASGSIASYYYNAPFININGFITLAGKTIKVSGEGWLDREWSSSLFNTANLQQNKNKIGWDWLSLHLNPQQALMLFRVHHPDETHVTGVVINKNGQQTPLKTKQINWMPKSYKSFNGAEYPISWTLDIPSQKIKLSINPINNNQFLNGTIPYWEGAVKTTGSHQAKGYLELFGY